MPATSIAASRTSTIRPVRRIEATVEVAVARWPAAAVEICSCIALKTGSTCVSSITETVASGSRRSTAANRRDVAVW